MARVGRQPDPSVALPRGAEETIRAFVDAFDAAQEAMGAVYVIAWTHGVEYKGPDLTPQLAALRALIGLPPATDAVARGATRQHEPPPRV